ncbi:MAG: hypothetical protein HY323_08955 [Betaproteobacteria bacterium]|nr:hypothetical protein [Betaproteobacteria bacterium]
MANIGLASFGILYGMVALLVAFLVAGAGQGWLALMLFSLPLFGVVPAVLILWRHRALKAARAARVALAALAVALDAGLLVASTFEERAGGYVSIAWEQAPLEVTLWFLLWGAWQLLLPAFWVRGSGEWAP